MARRLLIALLFAVWTLCLSGVRFAHADAPLRVDCGGGGTVGTFRSDAYYSSSSPVSTTTGIDVKGVANAAPASIYQTQNTASSLLVYTLPGFTANGWYVVRLHFAELAFNAAGSRKMNVTINGANALNNFDIFATAGAKYRAVVKTFNTIADSTIADSSGNFTTGTDYNTFL